jgi:hypothetical protein
MNPFKPAMATMAEEFHKSLTPEEAAAKVRSKEPTGGGTAGKWGMAAGALLGLFGGPQASAIGSYVGSALGSAMGPSEELDAAIAKQNEERLKQDLYAKQGERPAGPRFQFGQGFQPSGKA